MEPNEKVTGTVRPTSESAPPAAFSPEVPAVRPAANGDEAAAPAKVASEAVGPARSASEAAGQARSASEAVGPARSASEAAGPARSASEVAGQAKQSSEAAGPAKQKNNVRKIRIERMMSKAELARRANLSVLTIDRIEKGFGCRMDTKRKILEALGLSLDDRVRVFGEEE